MKCSLHLESNWQVSSVAQVLRFVKSATTYSSVHFFGFLKLMETVFKSLVASRGYHVYANYGKTVWAAPKRGQKLYAKKETNAEALLVD